MCGIVAVVSRPASRPVPSSEQLLSGLDAALGARPDLEAVAAEVHAVDALLRGAPGIEALVGRAELVAGLTARLDQLDAVADDEERRLEALEATPSDELEAANATLIRLRDALWAVRRDRIRT